MNLVGNKLPSPLLIFIKALLVIYYLIFLPILIYFWWRYPWIKTDYEYLRSNGTHLTHLTNYKNVLDMETKEGFLFQEYLTINNLINCHLLWFTIKRTSAKWFFLGTPNGAQIWSNNLRGCKASLFIKIEEIADILKNHDIYIRKVDSAVMVIANTLLFPHSKVCLGETMKSKANYKLFFKILIGAKKSLS